MVDEKKLKVDGGAQQKRRNQQRESRKDYKRDVLGLETHTFNIGGSKQAGQFVKTLEEIATYCEKEIPREGATLVPPFVLCICLRSTYLLNWAHPPSPPIQTTQMQYLPSQLKLLCLWFPLLPLNFSCGRRTTSEPTRESISLPEIVRGLRRWYGGSVPKN
jgi:hypothetical protein